MKEFKKEGLKLFGEKVVSEMAAGIPRQSATIQRSNLDGRMGQIRTKRRDP